MVMILPTKKAPESRASSRERQKLGIRLREARKKAGFTLEGSAEAIGVVRQAVYSWEAGQTFPTADRLERAAEIYNVSLDWLFAQEKRIAEAPAIYLTDEPLSPENHHLLKEFKAFLSWRQRQTHTS